MKKEETVMRSNYGSYRNFKFSDIWSRANDFLTDYKDSGLYDANNKISDGKVKELFYLLYARYGNSTIASSDFNQFKYQVFEIIFEYGPTWEKSLDIQNTLRNLSEDDLIAGGSAIYNHAYNPSTYPSTSTTEELDYINEQNVTKQTRTKILGYANLIELLKNDVTSRFLSHFKKLFLQIVQPDYPLYYYETEEEEEY